MKQIETWAMGSDAVRTQHHCLTCRTQIIVSKQQTNPQWRGTFHRIIGLTLASAKVTEVKKTVRNYSGL